jgi:hypothetical protein
MRDAATFNPHAPEPQTPCPYPFPRSIPASSTYMPPDTAADPCVLGSKTFDASFHILHSRKVNVPHSVQCLPGHISFGPTMGPVEEILLGKGLAPSVVGYFEQGAVVGEHCSVGLEDYKSTVEIVWAELVLVLLF